ncbi:MAG: hydroxymethylbilane synthase [Bacteroidetes bacterium]|nr:MAG: hydroxymethylbilane synthase [Bacteroidota bacterium]
MSDRILRIGTRGSKLAIWQTQQVESSLSELGIAFQRVVLKSQGDLDQHTPLEQFGTPGVFTRKFDAQLLSGQIDMAVHSLKDYPAVVPAGIAIAAYLKRGNPLDTLVTRKPLGQLQSGRGYRIATSSSRRRTQWLHRFPNSKIEAIRGNVPTRLKKLEQSNWDGAIFARAGLERLGLYPKHTIDLEWMVPAPGQAVVAVACREDDQEVIRLLKKLNEPDTEFTSRVERHFMALLGGGCEAPIGGYLQIKGEQKVLFKGTVLDFEANNQITGEYIEEKKNPEALAELFAERLIRKGVSEILNLKKV